MNHETILTKIDEIRNYLIDEITRNEFISKKHKKVCRVQNYIEHSLILISAITGCVSISGFAFLVGIPIGITSSTIGLKICLITAVIKNYKSMNIKNKKKPDKIKLLNSIEILISKSLIHSNIIHDEFVLINNVLKIFYDMKEEIKNSNNK